MQTCLTDAFYQAEKAESCLSIGPYHSNQRRSVLSCWNFKTFSCFKTSFQSVGESTFVAQQELWGSSPPADSSWISFFLYWRRLFSWVCSVRQSSLFVNRKSTIMWFLTANHRGQLYFLQSPQRASTLKYSVHHTVNPSVYVCSLSWESCFGRSLSCSSLCLWHFAPFFCRLGLVLTLTWI